MPFESLALWINYWMKFTNLCCEYVRPIRCDSTATDKKREKKISHLNTIDCSLIDQQLIQKKSIKTEETIDRFVESTWRTDSFRTLFLIRCRWPPKEMSINIPIFVLCFARLLKSLHGLNLIRRNEAIL